MNSRTVTKDLQLCLLVQCFISLCIRCVYVYIAVEDVSLNKNGGLLQERLHAVHRKVSNFNSTILLFVI